MFKSGLTSVTFRSLKPVEIVDLVTQAGLDAIEWGGDVHVPHGDKEKAREIRAMTEARGLITSSYGSYYRVGAEANPPFEAVLETAIQLGAPTIRLWAGDRPSLEADDAYWQRFTEETLDIAGRADKAGIAIAFEYHRNTLTDTDRAVRRLLASCSKGRSEKNIRLYWQPPLEASPEECESGLDTVLEVLENLHVFFCVPGAGKPQRRPLAEGEGLWKRYLARTRAVGGDDFALIEFVQEDSPRQFLSDARILRRLLSQGSG